MSKFVDSTGQKFNKLLILKITQKRTTSQKITLALCICDCGTEKTVNLSQVRCNRIKSCGCLQKETAGKSRQYEQGKAAFYQACRQYKRHAKDRSLKWELTEEQTLALFKADCKYCNNPPSNTQLGGKRSGSFIYNGIDRVDNKLGYSVENTVTCCKTCNWMKKDLTSVEFMEHIINIYNKIGR